MNEAADFKSAVSTYSTIQATLLASAIQHELTAKWRRGPESNRPTRICNPVHNRFATAPYSKNHSFNTKKGSCCFPFRLLFEVANNTMWSGKRGSNSRPQPWQGCALPTELFPHRLSNYSRVFSVFDGRAQVNRRNFDSLSSDGCNHGFIVRQSLWHTFKGYC